jgi:hypothetical protein
LWPDTRAGSCNGASGSRLRNGVPIIHDRIESSAVYPLPARRCGQSCLMKDEPGGDPAFLDAGGEVVLEGENERRCTAGNSDA